MRSIIFQAFVPAFFILMCSIFMEHASAQAPKLVHYQAFLQDVSTGQPFNGKVNITFRIYADSTASFSARLWEETHSDVSVIDGVYSLFLGMHNPFTPKVLAGGDRFLGIQINNAPELSPRQRIASSFYTLRSIYADTLAGFGVSKDRMANTLLPLDSTGKVPRDALPPLSVDPHHKTHEEGGDDVITVTDTMIAKRTITGYEKIAIGTITGVEIQDLSIEGEDIADLTIDTGKIQDGAIIREKIANSAVTSAKIADSTIVNEDISSNALIAQSKISNTAHKIHAANADSLDHKPASAFADSAHTHRQFLNSVTFDSTVTMTNAITMTKDASITSKLQVNGGVSIQKVRGEDIAIFISGSGDDPFKKGIVITGTDEAALDVTGDVFITGYLIVNGDTLNKKPPQSLQLRFGSSGNTVFAGKGSLRAGEGQVVFAPGVETLLQGRTYSVFVAPRGLTRGVLYISEQTPAGFVVSLQEIPGLESFPADIEFDWIVAVSTIADEH